MKEKIRSLLHSEVVSYAFWGVVTSVLNIGVFQLLFALGIDYRLSNLVALLLAKISAYLVNKFFVFHSHTASHRALFLEIIRYVVTRGFTMLIDYFGLILLTSVLSINPRIGKVVVTILVVALNYLFGKFHVFKDGRV